MIAFENRNFGASNVIVQCSSCQLRYDASGKPAGSDFPCRCGKKISVPFASSAAVSLHCPNCGSPASPHHNTCEFCGTQLAVLNCPSCFTLQFAGSRHCSNCGDKLMSASRDESQKDHNCPRCEGRLESRLIDDISIDQCDGCGGVWLDHDVLEAVVKKARNSRDAASWVYQLPAPPVRVNDHEVKYLECPECQKLMHRRNFGVRSGVIIDVCAAHGLWFDADELAAALVFVRSGGDQTSLKFGAQVSSNNQANNHKANYSAGIPQHRSKEEFGWSDLVSAVSDMLFVRW